MQKQCRPFRASTLLSPLDELLDSQDSFPHRTIDRNSLLHVLSSHFRRAFTWITHSFVSGGRCGLNALNYAIGERIGEIIIAWQIEGNEYLRQIRFLQDVRCDLVSG